MIDPLWALGFAQEWIEAWNSHDMERILSHYSDDFEMASPLIVERVGELSGVLKGKAAVRLYWQQGLAAQPPLRFELLDVLCGVRGITIYYRSIGRRVVAEVLEFNSRNEVIRGAAHWAVVKYGPAGFMKSDLMTGDFCLREVVADDLALFFDFQLDPDANYMAAFIARDPTDRQAFTAHWNKIMADPTNIIRTIVCDGQVVGSVSRYEESGKPEVTYWIGRAHWGKGIGTRALTAFLAQVNTTRPIYARVAQDNLGSRRVLEKCGFQVIGETKGFANARGGEIEELLLELPADAASQKTSESPIV